MGRFTSAFDPDEPQALALIVCDQVITEAGTNRKTMIGTFDTINALQLPITMPRMGIYFVLSKGQKDESGPFLLGIFAPDETPLLRTAVEIADWGAAGIAEMSFNVMGLTFVTEGVYTVQLFQPGRVLLERRITVGIPPQSPEAQADSPTP